MTPEELDALLAFAKDVARGAGRIQMDGLSATPEIHKKGRRELVTPIDHACEAYVIGRVQAAYPDHGYFAEEGHVREAAVRWIVDPLDGTTNYSQRLPGFSVSLGLEVAGEVALGVVYAPYHDELFWARAGGGAWCQWGNAPPRRMQVSTTDALEEAVLATGFAYVLNETPNTNLDNWTHLSSIVRGLRRIGSAALDLAYVADGRFDGFWELHLKSYDVAAGVVLIREAGGRVSDLFGGEDWLEGQTFIGTNGALHDLLQRNLAPVQPDPWVRLPNDA